MASVTTWLKYETKEGPSPFCHQKKKIIIGEITAVLPLHRIYSSQSVLLNQDTRNGKVAVCHPQGVTLWGKVTH